MNCRKVDNTLKMFETDVCLTGEVIERSEEEDQDSCSEGHHMWCE